MNEININISFTSIITLLGAIQGIFLSVAIATNKNKKKESRLLLAFFIVSFSLVSFEDFLFDTNYIIKYPHFIDTFSGLVFVLPPTLYLYVNSEISNKRTINFKSFLHYIPFLILFLFITIGIFESRAEKVLLIMKYKNENSYSFNNSIIPCLIQTTIYLILIIITIRKYFIVLQKEYSNTQNNKLKKLLTIIYFFVLLFIIWIISWFIKSDILLKSINIAFLIFVYFLGYSGYNNEKAKLKTFDIDDSIEKIEKKKYEKSKLTEQDKKILSERITDYINSEKPYLNPELNLDNLANSLNVQPYELSQVLSEKLNTNFYNLINSYRVKETLKRLSLSENDKYTILSIAYDSGFNSKAAFYSVFRKHSGKSPSEYRNEIKKLNLS